MHQRLFLCWLLSHPEKKLSIYATSASHASEAFSSMHLTIHGTSTMGSNHPVVIVRDDEGTETSWEVELQQVTTFRSRPYP